MKNPFTFVHFKVAMQWIDLNSYNCLLVGSTLSIDYFFGDRISEYSPKSRDQWTKVVRRKDSSFVGANNDPVALIIDFCFHKTNKSGIYCGRVEFICSCDTGICPVHVTFKFTHWREREYDTAINEPSLLRLDERLIPQHQVTFVLKI